MTMVKTLVALATERMLLKTSGPTFLRGIEFMYAAGLAPDRLSVMMTTSHKFVLQFHSKCDIRPFAANYPNFARVLRGIVHVRAWRIKSIEFVNVAFYMRDVENLERAIEKLGVELVLLRNCTYPGVSRGEEAVKFLSALNRRKQAVVCEYGDDRLKHRIARRSGNRVRRPSRLNDVALARLNAENGRVGDRDAAAPAPQAPVAGAPPAPPPPPPIAPLMPAAQPVVAIQAMPPLMNPNYREAPSNQHHHPAYRLPIDQNVFAMALQFVADPVQPPHANDIAMHNFERNAQRNVPMMGPQGIRNPNARADQNPNQENAPADPSVAAVSAAAAAAAAAGAYFYMNNPAPPAQYVGLPLEDFCRLMQHRAASIRSQQQAPPHDQDVFRYGQNNQNVAAPNQVPVHAADPQAAVPQAAAQNEELSDTDAENEEDMELDMDGEREHQQQADEPLDDQESDQDDEEEEEEHAEEEEEEEDEEEDMDDLAAPGEGQENEEVEHVVLEQIIQEALNRSPSPQVALLR